MYILGMKPRVGLMPLPEVAYVGLAPGRLGRVTYAGCHEAAHATASMRMRYWDTYSVVYVCSGAAQFEDESGRRQPVGPGDLMLMFPRHGYRYLAVPDVPWTEIFVQFDGPVFDLWRARHLLRPAEPVWRLEPLAYWRPKLAEIAAPRVEGESEEASALRRVCLLQAFLAEAYNAVHRAEHDAGQSEWLKRAHVLLEENLGAYPDWEALADRLNLSSDRFRKRFRELTGQTPSQYRARRRITWASELLKDRRRPLADIAATCGYHDVFHFAKRFQQATGLTPAQFRQRHPGCDGSREHRQRGFGN